MKYLVLSALACAMVLTGICQENTALMQLVNAEKSFAAYATSTGIREAFLKYLDDSAKVFERGRILNGKEVWGARNTDSAGLIWYPEFAEVAASGDFGYTTGPAQYRVKKKNEKADYQGYFNSIWRKDKNGEWKVMLDMGTPAPGATYDESRVEYGGKDATVKKLKMSDGGDVRRVEDEFIQHFENGKAYSSYGDARGRYYRPGSNVMKGSVVQNDTLKFNYRNAGTGISSSGDLGYAYGYVTVSGKEGNYLRVWKKEMDGWKIVLDVATYQ